MQPIKAVAPQSSLSSPHSHFLFQTFTSQTPLLINDRMIFGQESKNNISINTVIGTLVINESNGSLRKVFIYFPSGAQVVCVWCVYVYNISYTSYVNCVFMCIRENCKSFHLFLCHNSTATRITTFLQLVFFLIFFLKILNSHNLQINFRKTSKIIKIALS